MRRPFAGAAATVLVGTVGVNAGATVTVWDSPVGGSQVTDLLTPDGTPLANGQLQSDNKGVVPEFQGPDNGAGQLWLDGGYQSRVLVLSNDLHDRLAAAEATIADLQTQVAQGGGGSGGGSAGSIDDGTP